MDKLTKFLAGLVSVLFLSVILSACGGSGSSITSIDVVTAFEDEGLEVGESREMTRDDYGMGPNKAEEGTIFTVPFVCDDCNVRVISYDKDKDLEQMKDYYDELGRESAMLYSHTAKHGNILVQANGDMEDGDFEKYEKALSGM